MLLLLPQWYKVEYECLYSHLLNGVVILKKYILKTVFIVNYFLGNATFLCAGFCFYDVDFLHTSSQFEIKYTLYFGRLNCD